MSRVYVICSVCGCDVAPWTDGFTDGWFDVCEDHPLCCLCGEPYAEDDDRATVDGACPACAKTDAVECPACGARVVDLTTHGYDAIEAACDDCVANDA